MTDFASEPTRPRGPSAGAFEAPRAPGKTSLTQRLARPAGASTAATDHAPAATAPAPDPAVEHDLAVAVGFLDGPTAAPANSGAKDKRKQAKPAAAPAKPAATKAGPPSLIGCEVYLHSLTEGTSLETGRAVTFPAGTWVLLLEEEWGVIEEPRKNGTVAVDRLLHAVVESSPAASSTMESRPVRIDGKAVTIPDQHTLAAIAAEAKDKALERAGGKPAEQHVAFAAEFNREFAPLLDAFDGGLTSATAHRAFSAEQIEALWFYFKTKLIPKGLFTSLASGDLTVPQRILLSSHILTFGQYPKGGEVRKAQADFCYHWVQLVWNYAGINEATGGNAGTRGVVGPTEEISFGAGKQLYADEHGNPLGQQPADPSLKHYAKSAGVEGQTTRRGSLGVDKLESMIQPGDWLWVYNANGSTGGGHSVVFASWLDGSAATDSPQFQPAPALKGADWHEEHDGEKDDVIYAVAQVYSQTNNSPKANSERGGKKHTLRIGPYYYRQFRTVEKLKKSKGGKVQRDAAGEPIVEQKEEEANEIVPVYCITRADPSSETPMSSGELLQYKRGAAIDANLALIKNEGLALEPLRRALATASRELLDSERLEQLDPIQRGLCDELIADPSASIEHLTDLVALIQRLSLPSKDKAAKVDGLLAHVALDRKALGGTGAPAAGGPLDLLELQTLALEANQRYVQKRDLSATRMLALVERKLAALNAPPKKSSKPAKPSTPAAPSSGAPDTTLATLSDAITIGGSDLQVLAYAVAQWQHLSRRPLTGFLQDVPFTKGELAKAKRTEAEAATEDEGE